MDLREIGLEGVDWSQLAQNRDRRCVLVIWGGGVHLDWLNVVLLASEDGHCSMELFNLVWVGVVFGSVPQTDRNVTTAR